PVDEAETALLRGLTEAGWVDGQNMVLEYRYTEGKEDLARRYAAELVESKVDLIIASGNIRIQAAKDATQTIPIVMTNAGDPVRTRFVESLARPGANVTGMSTLTPGLAGKRVELMREIAPRIGRLAVLSNPDNSASALNLDETRAAAATLGLEVEALDVRNRDDLERAFSTMEDSHAHAIIALGDAIFYTYRSEIAAFAIRNRLPTHYNLRGFVVAGGLMANGANFPAIYYRAASYVDRIFKGANAA